MLSDLYRCIALIDASDIAASTEMTTTMGVTANDGSTLPSLPPRPTGYSTTTLSNTETPGNDGSTMSPAGFIMSFVIPIPMVTVLGIVEFIICW